MSIHGPMVSCSFSYPSLQVRQIITAVEASKGTNSMKVDFYEVFEKDRLQMLLSRRSHRTQETRIGVNGNAENV